jgi:1-acyl-sn-glycerol-3-phosphate acyltransferase
VTGLEYVPRNGAAIIAANHLSAADEVFTPVSARRQVVYFGKAEYFTRPGLRGRFVSRLFREFGHVPVDRADTSAAAATIQTGVDLLADGKALGIYSEGTR